MNCSCTDQFYINDRGCSSNSVLVFAGQSAVSLYCDDSKDYEVSYYYERSMSEYLVRQVSCESKSYQYWNTSLSQNSLSFTFNSNCSQLIFVY